MRRARDAKNGPPSAPFDRKAAVSLLESQQREIARLEVDLRLEQQRRQRAKDAVAAALLLSRERAAFAKRRAGRRVTLAKQKGKGVCGTAGKNGRQKTSGCVLNKGPSANVLEGPVPTHYVERQVYSSRPSPDGQLCLHRKWAKKGNKKRPRSAAARLPFFLHMERLSLNDGEAAAALPSLSPRPPATFASSASSKNPIKGNKRRGW